MSLRAKNSVIILGAGRPLRAETPSVLRGAGPNRRVLDWLVDAFAPLDDCRTKIVSGFAAEAFVGQRDNVDVVYNARWQSTGPVGSLALALEACDEAVYSCYADTVFRPAVVEQMAGSSKPITVAIDTAWRSRYDNRSRSDLAFAEKVRVAGSSLAAVSTELAAEQADGEFTGLVRLGPTAVAALQEALASGQILESHDIPTMLAWLLQSGLDSEVIDVCGDWAELNAPQDLARFVLGTKAESLARLRPLLTRGYIDAGVVFSSEEWRSDPDTIVERIRGGFGDERVIVRSSARSEDTWTHSAAGQFESISDVDSTVAGDITEAVNAVIASYLEPTPSDQVLVQRMLRDVDVSGVVMTRTPNLLAPYYVVNFDALTKRTDTVTAGTGSAIRTLFVHRDAEPDAESAAVLGDLFSVIREIEELVGHDALDIEFAITPDATVHVLQVRPMATPSLSHRVSDARVVEALTSAKTFFAELQTPSPFVVGARTQLSVMTDWNPAEIIGTKPRPLAFSLYRALVTDEVWARQRAEYGYRDVRPCNLLVDLLGHPYIDVRATFNSFVPAEISDDLAQRLVETYLDRLRRQPHLHDKVEFDILLTCLTFDFEAEAATKLGDDFTSEELESLRASLLGLTAQGMQRCDDDLAALERFSVRAERLANSEAPPLERAYALLADLQRTGLLIFSHLARAGFVAVALLRSLERTGRLQRGGEGDFIAGLQTPSRRLQEDGGKVARGELDWGAFAQTYSHLRPGTYDITCPHYGSEPEAFLRPFVTDVTEHTSSVQAWSDDTRREVGQALAEIGLPDDVDAFQRFLGQAIEGREHSKFVFTRSLSAALELIAEFGASHGFDREALSLVRIDDLWALRGGSVANVRVGLARAIDAGRARFDLTRVLALPEQVVDASDLDSFERLPATPHFVTDQVVRAPAVFLSAATSPHDDLEGKIAVTPNADPGFDWVFGRNIVGLITMYGGSNSHMAIRASESRLPAAIGVGELLFEKLAEARVIELNCSSGNVRTVN